MKGHGAAFWGPLVQLCVPLVRLGGALGGLEQVNLIFARKTKGTGNQKANPRSTEEAPGRHQGGTKEAPGKCESLRGAPEQGSSAKKMPRGSFLPSDLFSKKKISKSI